MALASTGTKDRAHRCCFSSAARLLPPDIWLLSWPFIVQWLSKQTLQLCDAIINPVPLPGQRPLVITAFGKGGQRCSWLQHLQQCHYTGEMLVTFLYTQIFYSWVFRCLSRINSKIFKQYYAFILLTLQCYTVNWTLGCLSRAHGMSSGWGRVTNTSWHGPNSGLRTSANKLKWWFWLLMTCKDRLSQHTKNVTISWTENSRQVVMKPPGFWEGRTEHAKTWRYFKETEAGSDLWSNQLK